MIFVFILCCLYFSILCSFHPGSEPIFFNETNEINITELANKVKFYEGEMMRIYRKSSRYDEMVCDKMDENIKLMQELRNNYTATMNTIDNGRLNDVNDERHFIELRGDMLFGRRNVEICIERLKKRKEYCFKDSSEAEKYYNEYKQKNRKRKEDIIRAVKQIADINNL